MAPSVATLHNLENGKLTSKYKKAESTVIIFIALNIIELFASQPSLYTLNNLLPHLQMFNLDISIYQGPRDGDGNENFEKAIGLVSETTILHVKHALLYISSPSLHDYDVKIPNFMLEDVNKGRRIFLSLFKLELGLPKKSTQGNTPTFDFFGEKE